MRALGLTLFTSLLLVVGWRLWDETRHPGPAAEIPSVERSEAPARSDGTGEDVSGTVERAPSAVRSSIDEAPGVVPDSERRGLRVVARFDDGAPVAGVAVAMWRSPVAALGESSDTLLGRWVSEVDGRVPVDSGIAALVPGGMARASFVAELPFATARAVEWGGHEEGEVTVEVPPTGALAFEVVDGEGRAWQGRGMVAFDVPPSERRPCDRVVLVDGRARVPHAGTGVELPLLVDTFAEYRPVRLTLPPLARDEGERAVRVVLRERFPIGLVRFVDETGAALGRTRGLVQPCNRKVEADDEGRARVVLDGLDTHAGPVTVTFTMQHSNGSRDLNGEVVVQTPLRDGDLELGAVVLRPTPCLVAGRLVRPDGRPWPFERLAVVGRAPDGSWRVLDEVGMSASDGTILMPAEVAGIDELQELALDLGERAWPKLAAPVPFEVGQRDLLVIAPEPESVSGTVRWEGPAPPPELEVLSLREAGPPLRTPVRASGTFAFRSLPPGRVTLAVVARGSSDLLSDPRELVTSAATARHEDTTASPRTPPLDWTVGAGVRDLRFTVSGQGAHRSTCLYRSGADTPFEHPPEEIEKGHFRVLTRASRVDLLFRSKRKGNEELGVIDDLRAFEALELGPQRVARAR